MDDSQIKRLNDVPFTRGGYSDIWHGLYQGESVSIKAFRVRSTDNLKFLTKVSRFLSNGIVDH